MALLLREAIGDRLRRARNGQHRTLREVSRAARVSLGYLSEVERGRKEASSELLAAICGALELPLADLLREVAFDLGDGVPAGVPGPTPDRDDRQDEFARDDFERQFNRELDKVIEGGRLAGVSVGEAKAELQIAPRLAQRLAKPISQSPVRPLSNAELSARLRSAMFAA